MLASARRLWTSLSPPTRQFGIPFVTFLVVGTYGLSYLTAGRYELDDERRVRAQIGADARKPVAPTDRPSAVTAVVTAVATAAAAGRSPLGHDTDAAPSTAPSSSSPTAAPGSAAADAAAPPPPPDYTIVRIPRRGERPAARGGDGGG
ncbi:hypothetical protein BU14_0104s0017 [Porphyra umbilicalis]|uniref:Uncharacterized protein n=1 Tax=Porphyra umbilicalis TaxID=2786 RepID=A0A1X6PDC1_PORUM|nr:hypothetical protein BU14_0104s0017 [Porphyra umbilicalis]|eukprot:OSX78643.1 hypothetical protein BU14_0104s0017 [Porphyra umbilicalis]